MSDEIIEEVQEEVQEEAIETPEGGEVEQQEEVTPDIFNPDELEFEESFELEGYDLSKYKDTIDLENKDTIDKAKQFKKLGFTQEQIEFYLEDVMQPTEPTAEPTAKEIQERLANSLTPAEKRNYKAVNSFVNSALEGMTYLNSKGEEKSFEELAKESMKNPILVKMLNALYSKTNNAGAKTSTPVTKREVSKEKIDVSDARDKYREWMQTTEVRTPEKRREFLNNMIKNSDNEKELTKAFEELLKA